MYDQFPHFQHLRIITCAVRSKRWRSQHVQAIAKNCPSLEKIECCKGKRLFHVNREPSNGEVTVHASSKDGEGVNTEDEMTDSEYYELEGELDSNYDGSVIGSDVEWELRDIGNGDEDSEDHEIGDDDEDGYISVEEDDYSI